MFECECPYCEGDCDNCICKLNSDGSCRKRAEEAARSSKFKELMKRMREMGS